jgi:hypothetical protein
LSGIVKDLGPKGFAVVEAATNDNPDVPGFIQKYSPPFPVGTANVLGALEFLQWPPMQRVLVPLIAFIDRGGMIRAQYTGMDTSFFGDDMEKNIREEVEKLLKEPVPRITKSTGSSKSKKSADR